ncbi:olfactory receptor 7C1-like [Oryctolagus cuniculus]|uniref:olfactory receptor 7C1-like n=1 Tax=Oryctolagus cuniculus TaxID=9986 RepID=UPI0038794B2C
MPDCIWVPVPVVTTTVPKMLQDIKTQNYSITFTGCITQMYFFMVFGGMDTLLLTWMAYDRFVALCHPLHYPVIMNPHLCGLLVLVSWCISLSCALIQSLLMLRLSCTRWVVAHFYCELAQVFVLACSDTFINYTLLYMVTALLGFVPLSGILFSYMRIVSSILKIPSTGGRYKAFSTCGSHLTVVSLFYRTGLGVYLSSDALSSSWKGMVASVMYTVVTPMLNPFIYSLRNRDIKRALQSLLGFTLHIQ